MKHGSLFSGIGGFDLAAQWMGWENVFHCEWNKFGANSLKSHWPQAIKYHDITKSDFTLHRGSIDILTGGFPCQPYSTAGKRLGKADDRHLWPEMLRAIREIAPIWVVGENVRGLVSWNGGLVFDEVQSELEDCGYEVLPFILPACAVNAPHRRDRIWFIAHSSGSGTSRDAGGINLSRELFQTTERDENEQFDKPSSSGRAASNPSSLRSCGDDWEREVGEQCGKGWPSRHIADGDGSQGAFANTLKRRLSQWYSEKLGQQEQNPYDKQFSSPSKWDNFPTQSPIRVGNDGFPIDIYRDFLRADSNGILSEKEINRLISKARGKWRTEAIKAGGNAIVPQVALQIFKAIQQYEITHEPH